MALDSPVTGSATKMSPSREYETSPLPAGPNGGGSFAWREPTNTATEMRRARITSATAMRRNGIRGAIAGRLAISAMGNHLSGKVQAGRWLVAAVSPRMSVR